MSPYQSTNLIYLIINFQPYLNLIHNKKKEISMIHTNSEIQILSEMYL